MKALCWHGQSDVRIDQVPDPVLKHPTDILVQVTSTAICGSDLHLFDGYMPEMKNGDVLGHEFMGKVIDIGSAVQHIKVGDRVVVPFCISCGECWFCQNGLTSCCDNSNPGAEKARKLMGHAPAGLFGYSHLTGGYSGGQAEFVRVPWGDVNAFAVPDHLTDEQVLFLTDIFPTGYMAAENCNIQQGDTVAVWGCGPVGQFAIRSALMLGACRVIAIDNIPERLQMARDGGAETINFEEGDVYEKLMSLTDHRGPDACLDAVGCEAHVGPTLDAIVDKAKTLTMLGTDRPHVLRETIKCCRKAGHVSVPGVYVGYVDKLPFGAAMNKGLTFKMGQTHVHRYLEKLLGKIEDGTIDPRFVITHRVKLDEAPEMYKAFRDREQGCIKVVMTP